MYPQKEFDEDAEDRMINEKIRVRGSLQTYGTSCDSRYIRRTKPGTVCNSIVC